MGKKRRTEITIETERLLLLRDSSRSLFLWCDACCAQVRMLTPEEAASTAQVSVRAIYRRVEAGELHFIEMPEWPVLICANSVLNQQST
jgi:hypothetical protein